MTTGDHSDSSMDFLIEPPELQTLTDSVTLIDARSEQAYAQGHIPGAVFLTTYHCFVSDTSPGGMMTFVDDVSARYAAVGVSHDCPVVVYEDETGMRAARELWILQYLGHRDVRMLHGGLREWQAIGGLIEKTPTTPTPTTFEARPPRSGFIALRELLGGLHESDRQVLDVRDATEFAGHDETACCERRGHVPGAKWLEWTELLQHGRFKSPAEIRALLAARGIAADAELVPYCHRGARSANSYYALRYAGCPRVRNFIGSFHEWSAHEGAPVEI